MDKLITICQVMLPSIAVWHVFAIFVYSDSPYQKRRFRKALEKINESCCDKYNIIHKNKQFTVEVSLKKLNAVYSYYEIFINDKIAATYHILTDTFRNSYQFKEENKRHRYEVESIVYATDRHIKLLDKPKKEKVDGYSEHSYFK